MLIKKEDAKIFSNILKASKTKNMDTFIKEIVFYKEKGILFKFTSDFKTLFLKNKDVDFDRSISSNIFVSAVLSEIEKNEEANITFNEAEGNIYVGNNIFSSSGINPETIDDYFYSQKEDNEDEYVVPFVTFTNEQWKKLSKDFVYTLSNSFLQTKSTATIGFTFSEDKTYKLLPSIFVYKISSFDATIDNVAISQIFGHNTRTFLLPEKVYEMFEDAENIKFTIRGAGGVYVWSDKIFVSYTACSFGVENFKARLSHRFTDEGGAFKYLSYLKNLKDFFKSMEKHSFENYEDSTVEIKFEGSSISVFIDGMVRTFEESSEFPTCGWAVPLHILCFLLDNYSENVVFKKVNDLDELLITEEGKEEWSFLPYIDLSD